MKGVLKFDVVIIGSGFGGSVSAMRLTEKGYQVAVLEAGKRFTDSDFPKTSWSLRSYLFFPKFGFKGIQRLSLLKDVFILSGAGVGGGSLVYANTLYEPPDKFYDDPQWSGITDWKQELAPFYDQAKRMLGVQKNPRMTPADEAILSVAKEMGVEKTFTMAPVGVYFGTPGLEAQDPYFGGKGPKRSGCQFTGECMTGCRHNAKNTLVKNYLYLAEGAGAKVFPLTTVTSVRPLEDGRFSVETVETGRWTRKNRRTFIAKDVIFAAGTLGTQKLLHQMKAEGILPKISHRLGELTRTNSEAIVGARSFDKKIDFTKGLAITSSIHVDHQTHIEPVRYGRGSNAMGLLATFLTHGETKPRFFSWIYEFIKSPGNFLRTLNLKNWSQQSIIALVMQTCDNSITLFTKKSIFGTRLSTRQGIGEPNPNWIPMAHRFTRKLAAIIKGMPTGSWNEVFNIPMTAHFLGGAVIGSSQDKGVIDPYHRVYHYPGLHVVDGSSISANLGVNPSLTITAMAERAMSLWPNKGDLDQRPSQGDPYVIVAPVTPKFLIVPEGAPGALRLKIEK
jgi:cholesterol oxidase